MFRWLRLAPRAGLISRRMGLASMVVPASTPNPWLTSIQQKINSLEVANVMDAAEGAEFMRLVQSMSDHSETMLAAKNEVLAAKDQVIDQVVSAKDQVVSAMDQVVSAKDLALSLQSKTITDLQKRTPQNHPLLGRPSVSLSCLSRARCIRRSLPERSCAVEARGYPAGAVARACAG